MEIRAGTEASAARLDPEQVAEHGDDEVRVQMPGAVTQAERHDREALELGVPEDLDVRVGAPRAQRAAGEIVLAAADLVAADGVLQRERDTGADRLDDSRRASLLADLGLG